MKQKVLGIISCLGLMLLLTLPASAQRYCELVGSVFVVKSARQANFIVYIEESEAFADMLVFKEPNRLFADKKGMWHFTDTRDFAQFTIYFTEDRDEADFSIYYTTAEAFAGCR